MYCPISMRQRASRYLSKSQVQEEFGHRARSTHLLRQMLDKFGFLCAVEITPQRLRHLYTHHLPLRGWVVGVKTKYTPFAYTFLVCGITSSVPSITRCACPSLRDVL